MSIRISALGVAALAAVGVGIGIPPAAAAPATPTVEITGITFTPADVSRDVAKIEVAVRYQCAAGDADQLAAVVAPSDNNGEPDLYHSYGYETKDADCDGTSKTASVTLDLKTTIQDRADLGAVKVIASLANQGKSVVRDIRDFDGDDEPTVKIVDYTFAPGKQSTSEDEEDKPPTVQINVSYSCAQGAADRISGAVSGSDADGNLKILGIGTTDPTCDGTEQSATITVQLWGTLEPDKALTKSEDLAKTSVAVTVLKQNKPVVKEKVDYPAKEKVAA